MLLGTAIMQLLIMLITQESSEEESATEEAFDITTLA